MIVSLGYSDRRTMLGEIILDVLVSEQLVLESEVTRWPVEDGTEVSDHITRGPETLRLAGLVATADATALSYGAGGEVGVADVLERLKAIHAARALVAVSTPHVRHEGFAFTSLEASRSNGPEGGNWLSVQGTLTKVRKVALKTAEVPAERAQEPAKGRAGKTAQAAGRSSPSSAEAGAKTGAGASPGANNPAAGATQPAQGSVARNLRDMIGTERLGDARTYLRNAAGLAP